MKPRLLQRRKPIGNPKGPALKPPLRNVILGISLLAIVGSGVAFVATGMYPYTRFRDSEIEAANAETDLADLFADTEEQDAPAAVESVNAIGFLPSGPGAASISVVTVTGPAVVAIGLALWFGRRKASGKADAESGAVST